MTNTPVRDQLAYVLYTSGSTGRPKGVAITHGALCNFMSSMREVPGFSASDALVSVTTVSFDISGLELFLPLTVGGSVIVASREDADDAFRLSDLLDRCSASVMQATPSTWRMLVDAGWRGSNQLKALCGGEELSRELAGALLPLVGELWNMYGPTETTIWSAVGRVGGTVPISLGQPIANTQLHVLDPDTLDLLPPGVVGELFIGGAGLARGYWRRPGLTAARFLPDPYADQPGARLYRTGDRVRRHVNGQLEFLGRTDHQVKIRGHRIELAEIEAVLAAHPAVRECAVVARPGPGAVLRLVAYVTLAGEEAASDQALRDHVSAQLPDHMIPTLFVALDRLPLTANRKLDRGALPVPDWSNTSGGAPVAPRNEDEKALAEIWSQLFGVPRVGVRDNFFEIGGHSLLATQLLVRVRRQFGVDIPLRHLFEAPTIEGLARQLTSLRRAARLAEVPHAVPAPNRSGSRQGSCSPIQERLFGVREAHPELSGSPPFKLVQDLTLTGPLDARLLASALSTVVRRQWSLRTRLSRQGDQLVQTIIDPSAAGRLEIHDLRQAKDRDQPLPRLVDDLLSRPLEIDRGIPFRAAVAMLDDLHARLILAWDHLVFDGRSLEIATAEMLSVYEALRADPARNSDLVLGELEHQYIDWAEDQRRLLAGEYGRELYGYWTQRLAAAPALELPQDRSSDDELGPVIGCRQLLDPGSLYQLDLFVRRHRLMRPTALLAALFAMLHRMSGQTDLCMVMPTDSRSADMGRVVGHFTLPLFIRVQIHDRLCFLDLCRQVQEAWVDAQPWQRVPLYALWAVPRGLRRMSFNYQRRTASWRAGDLGIAPTSPAHAVDAYLDLDLQLHCVESTEQNGAFTLWLAGRGDKFRSEALNDLLRHMIVLIPRLVADPQRPLAAITAGSSP